MSIRTWRSGASAIPENNALQLHTDSIPTGGVIDLGSANHFQITAQSPAAMAVNVNSGRAYVAGSGNTYPVISDAIASTAIAPNSSGQTRIDSVVLYINLAATPTSDGQSVATLVSVQGTPSGSPIAPNAAAIQAAIGSSNPYIVLANITVASGVTSIVTGNITDARSLYQFKTVQEVLTQQSSTPASPSANTLLEWADTNGLIKTTDPSGNSKISGETSWVNLTDGATVTIDLSKGKKFFLPLMAGNRILALSNEYVGKDFVVKIEQDSTGTRLISQWPQYAVTATITIASPGVITTGIDIPTGTPVILSTTGALPTGLVAGTIYYYIRQNSTTGNLATSLANAQAGTAINTSGSQSGVHTCNVQIRWAGQAAPTLTTGKYRRDEFGISIVATGIYEGYVVGQDV
jgi:hypothetical protein